MGTFMGGEQWVTNGYWAAKADLVGGLTTEQISAFAVGSGWRDTGVFIPEEKGVSLDAILKTDGLDLTDCMLSSLSIGDKKDRFGFTIDSDNVLQMYKWEYLTPVAELHLRAVRGKGAGVYVYDQEKLVARVIPYQLDRPASKQMAESIEKFRATTFPA